MIFKNFKMKKVTIHDNFSYLLQVWELFPFARITMTELTLQIMVISSSTRSCEERVTKVDSLSNIRSTRLRRHRLASKYIHF